MTRPRLFERLVIALERLVELQPCWRCHGGGRHDGDLCWRCSGGGTERHAVEYAKIKARRQRARELRRQRRTRDR